MMYSLIISFVFLFIGEKTVIHSAEFQTVVATYVQETLKPKYADAFVEYRSLPEAVTLPQGNYTLRVAVAGGTPQKGYMGIPVEVWNGEKLVNTILCSVVVRTFDEAVVAIKQIEKNENLDPQFFILQKIETTTENDLVTSLEQIKEFRSKRLVKANSVLRTSMMEEIPSVLQNEVVSVVVKSKNLSIGTAGIAKQDGRIGDEIKIQRNGVRDFITAKVIGKKAVEIIVQ